MAYTDIDNPELYHQTKIYTGNGNDDRDIVFDVTDTSMEPNMLWSARRDSGDNISLYDSVRGDGKEFRTAESAGEYDRSDNIQALNSNGFQVGTDSQVNANSGTYVSWAWKAGTAFSNDASATGVGSVDTAGTINTTAGISLMGYTGVSGEQTIAHGLSAVPKFIMVKNRDSSENWRVYHHSIGAGAYLKLNTTDAKTDDTGPFSNTTPTSTLVTMGGDDGTMHASEALIAYIFAEKQGYSKFGKYIGNGNADGPFVYTGFKPAWVLQKNISATQGWQLQDNKREGYNGDNDLLQPHTASAESGVNRIDLLSNGFKVITTDAGQNSSGAIYVYAAFAENPFVNSNGVPGNAE